MRDHPRLRFTFWLGMGLAAVGLVWIFTPPRDADTSYVPWVQRPGYGRRGPQLLIDEAHGNTHTAQGAYAPLAKLYARDGYRVSRGRQRLFRDLLEPCQVLVIANPAARFEAEEVGALRNWVAEGGGLLLVAGSPAARPLAALFGAEVGETTEPAGIDRSAPSHPVWTGREKYDHPVQHLFLFAGLSLRGTAPAVELARSRAIAIESGGGRVVVLTDADAFAARRVNGERLGINTTGADNAQFALNVAHWLSRLI